MKFEYITKIFKNQDVEDAKEQSHVLLNSSNIVENFDKVFSKNDFICQAYINNPVYVTESLWTDSGLQKWTTTQTYLHGSSHYLWNYIQQPTYDMKSLLNRQEIIKNIHKTNLNTHEIMSKIKICEKDVLWALNLPEFNNAWPLNIVYPVTPILKYINYYPTPLNLFHFYKIIVAPMMNVITPISTIFGPWIYIRRTLKFNIEFKVYINLLSTALMTGLKPSGNIRVDSIKYFSLFLYIFFYIYAIIQCFEHANILYKILQNLQEKLKSIQSFLKNVKKLILTLPDKCNKLKDFLPNNFTYEDIIFTIPNNMSGMYLLLTDNRYKRALKALLQWVYSYEIVLVANRFVRNKKCCLVNYIDNIDTINTINNSDNSNKSTKFWNMGHILLNKQVKNPLSLQKNLIITGPNAAGKTTYVRAVCTNSILSQTFGIACALHANISIIHALGSFMRIDDTLGQDSLFEAEAKRCSELIEQADSIVAIGKKALYFLDEPMHSTPPIEGSATSMAVIEYMGNLPGIRLMVTTHYHNCVELETIDPSKFQNISMDAFINVATNTYQFPYKIKNGASFKCIALELLSEKKLPPKLIKRAINLKNKICEQQISKNDI